MIRVTVEIWPRGDRTRAIEIARMNIANVSDLAPDSDLRNLGVERSQFAVRTAGVRGERQGREASAQGFDLGPAGEGDRWVAASAEK